ncbi:MAG: hypothetical protein IKC87_02290 [Clostridia bacterium]|nr:hypothetical protein [Clostridia bacterium]
MSKHPLFDLIVGFESASGSEVKGKRFVSKEVTGRVTGSVQSRFIERMTQGAQRFVDLVSYTSTRTYGLLLVGFGLLTLVLHFVKDYLGFSDKLTLPVVLIGALFAMIAIPLLSFDKPTAIAMQEFALTDWIFFEFFCIQRMHKKNAEHTVHPIIGLLLGLALAVVGAIVPVWYVAIGMGVAVYLYLALISPEFSFFFTFLAMPYLPMASGSEAILAILVAVTVISFVRKIAEGKRIYYFEQYDLFLLLLLATVFVNGVVTGGTESIPSSLVMLSLGFGGYALTGSLVANRRLADCVIKANIISSLPVSVIAIIQYMNALLSGGMDQFDGSTGTFDSPDMLAAFLLVPSAFMLYFVIARRNKGMKALYAIYLFVTLVAMATTLRAWVIVSVLAGILAYFALKSGNASGLWLGAIGFLPYLALFIPDDWLISFRDNPIVSFIGFDEYLVTWVESKALFVDNLFFGVGTGDFMDAPYSANFLLQIGLEAGVLVLFLFVAIFIVRLRHRSIYAPYIRSSEVGLISSFAEITAIAMLVYGLFTSLWAEPAVYYLFWCVFGLGSAVLRISKREFDDRVGYFSDGAGIDASSIDISLRH